MKKINFIKKMIESRQDKQMDKPKFNIGDLYIGNAVRPRGRGLIIYIPVKEYVICVYSKKHKHLVALNEQGLPYDCIIRNVIPYEDFLRDQMDEVNVDPDTKLSINDIKEAEYKYNKNQDYFTCD